MVWRLLLKIASSETFPATDPKLTLSMAKFIILSLQFIPSNLPDNVSGNRRHQKDNLNQKNHKIVPTFQLTILFIF